MSKSEIAYTVLQEILLIFSCVDVLSAWAYVCVSVCVGVKWLCQAQETTPSSTDQDHVSLTSHLKETYKSQSPVQNLSLGHRTLQVSRKFFTSTCAYTNIHKSTDFMANANQCKYEVGLHICLHAHKH